MSINPGPLFLPADAVLGMVDLCRKGFGIFRRTQGVDTPVLWCEHCGIGAGKTSGLMFDVCVRIRETATMRERLRLPSRLL